MISKKQKIYFWSLFSFIFISLLVIATIFDFQISELLASKGLVDGNYLSTNKFAIFFEIVGEMPLYVFVMFACAVLFVNFFNIKNKILSTILQALFFIIGVGVAVYGFTHFTEYLIDFFPKTFGFIEESKLSILVYVIIDVALEFLMVMILFTKFRHKIKDLTYIAVIILITAALANGVVQGVKQFSGRERFRSFYYLEYRGVEHQGFTNWYVFNGLIKNIISAYPEELGVTSSFYTSFPSGHTCGAATTYCLMFFPVFIEKLRNKKYSWIFIVFPIVYTGIVAFSRIQMGAHYLSDVLIAGTLTFLFSILAYHIVLRFNKNKA